MAPALASASANSDSIKGLAQSIAKPAYRRLLVAEPALRRAVPVLIIAFLVTMAIGAGVQVHDHLRQAEGTIVDDMQLTADLVAARLDDATDVAKNDVVRQAQARLDHVLPPRATDNGREILVSDIDGNVVASWPARHVGRSLLDVLGPVQPLTTFAANAGVLATTLADGTEAYATVRGLKAPLGQLAVIHRRRAALAPWRSDTTLTITLSATTGFVVLILGFAFHWQATRAREADAIYDTVRGRIDTALNRGRCGLWDWDLARGRIFWSHSMFDILGLTPRDDLLTFGEVGALVHPADIRLYELATELADGKTKSIDRAFRMRHARGDWVWLRVRCEVAQQRDGAGLHLVGIAVDITEQKDLMEKTIAADVRLRDAIETIPEAFVLWDADNRLVMCNSKYQELHGLPESAVAPGAAYG
ncbi:MAG TPA: PAS domain-containing protein, partial [Polyangia bacterium]